MLLNNQLVLHMILFHSRSLRFSKICNDTLEKTFSQDIRWNSSKPFWITLILYQISFKLIDGFESFITLSQNKDREEVFRHSQVHFS
jgi:hypothetical protein